MNGMRQARFDVNDLMGAATHCLLGVSSEEGYRKNYYVLNEGVSPKCISRRIALFGALLCGPVLPAQNSTVAPRITTDVNELSLATLKGNVPRLARAELDQGEAAPSTPLTHMRLVLSRSAEQQVALDSYLAQLQSKSSPNYHKWLTPEQFAALRPADSDIAAWSPGWSRAGSRWRLSPRGARI